MTANSGSRTESSAKAKRRVLLVLPDLAGGGAERTSLNLQKHLDPEHFAVEIALLEPRGEYLSSVSETRWIAPREGVLRRLARRFPADSVLRALPQVLLLRSLMKARRPDVVMSSMADVSVPLALAWALLPGARKRTRWIAREGNNTTVVLQEGFRSAHWRLWVERLIAYAYRRADVVIATSKGVAAELNARYGVESKRVIVIGNPVDLAAIERRAKEPPAIALPKKYMVAVGRLTRQKGFDLLLRAFAALADTELHLVIVGKGPDETALQNLAQSLGVGERVHFPGFLDNPWPVVAGAELFCLPSRWEGFGHVIVESMACGTPVVVSGCPYGPAEIVRNGLDGLVVVPDDWSALQVGLTEVLADPESALRRAESARVRAEDFSAARIAEAYGEAFASE